MVNKIDDLKAKARDFYWKYPAATTTSSSSDAITGLDLDAALCNTASNASTDKNEQVHVVVEATVSNRTQVANRNGLNIHFLSWYYD